MPRSDIIGTIPEPSAVKALYNGMDTCSSVSVSPIVEIYNDVFSLR